MKLKQYNIFGGVDDAEEGRVPDRGAKVIDEDIGVTFLVSASDSEEDIKKKRAAAYIRKIEAMEIDIGSFWSFQPPTHEGLHMLTLLVRRSWANNPKAYRESDIIIVHAEWDSDGFIDDEGKYYNKDYIIGHVYVPTDRHIDS